MTMCAVKSATHWSDRRWLLAALVASQTVLTSPVANAAKPTGKGAAALIEKTLLCDVAYLPTGAHWLRRVELGVDQQKVRTVRIDGLAVYSFAVSGTTVVTALDNERIQLDVAQLAWTSDLRGLASGQGSCELESPAR